MAHNPRTDNMTYFQELDTDEDGKVSFKESMPFADGNDESFMEHDKAKFKAAVKDGNGFLDAKEFPAWEWPEIDVEVEEAFARSLFQEKDKDKDGFLTLKEFFHYVDGEELHSEYLEEFKQIDQNQDGKLVLSETVAFESGRRDVEEAMDWVANHADTDEDGFVTLAELMAAKEALQSRSTGYHFEEWCDALEL